MWGRLCYSGKTAVNLLLAALILTLYVATATPAAQSAMSTLHGSPVYRGHREDAVALACCVSWDAAALPGLLETLKARDRRITFFLSGDWAKAHPAQAREIAAAGHEIGTLGQTPGQDGDVDAIAADLRASIAIIERITGERPALYHSGARDARTSTRAADRLGLTHVLGTTDLLSARGDAADLLRRALDRTFGGSILLFQPTREAGKALPACLDALHQAGYTPATIERVLLE